MLTPLDRLATAWLVRRGKLVDLKPWPMRLTIPARMSEEEADELRASWLRLHEGSSAPFRDLGPLP